MRATVEPGSSLEGSLAVPGDKSIAHRWLILAATAEGTSRLAGLPPSLDVRATAACLAMIAPSARSALQGWLGEDPTEAKGHGFTWDSRDRDAANRVVMVEGEGRSSLVEAQEALDCANSATTARLLAGVVAACPLASVFVGDESLTPRPMERVAAPLRLMGADVETTHGHLPMRVRGRRLSGRRYDAPVASAQVKSAILLAGTAASGTTTVVEPAATRDHTERALEALGARVERFGRAVSVRAHQHGGFDADVPGDLSSAMYLVVAAAVTGSSISISGIGLNPTRARVLAVLARMGVPTSARTVETRLGEPVGELTVLPGGSPHPTTVESDELALVIDEVPALAVLAAHADGPSSFRGAGELRLKETDRVAAIASVVRSLGGQASVEGDDLVIAGGGLRGGRADAAGDHRIAMASVVAGLGAREPVKVEGVEAADVSYPGFVAALGRLGARIAVEEA
jgi:3-phosphoshikimate 1-carboxyvinyltransferase